MSFRIQRKLLKQSGIWGFILLVLFYLPSSLQAKPEQAPRIRTLDVDMDELSQVVGDRRLIIIHEEQKIKNPDKNVRFVSALTVIDRPSDEVRQAILDFENYHDRVPYYKSARVLENESDQYRVNFRFVLQMAVISPTVSYDVLYRDGPQNDLLWKRKTGDIQHDQGRWEFIPLNDEQTLLVYTGWTDFSGLGWTVDTIMWAQPDLETAMPVTKAATIIDSFKEYFRGPDDPGSDTAESLPSKPEIPTFADKSNLQPEILAKVSQLGTPMFIHPTKWIHTEENGKLDFIFTTTFDVLNYDLPSSQKLTTQFDKTAQLIPQAQSVEIEEIPNGYLVDWNFDLGFGIFSVPVYYKVKYQWDTERILKYERVEGDLQHIYGALEWYPLSEQKTIYFFSSASHIGKKAPSIIQMANIIPNRQIFMGVTLGAAGVEKAVNWANSLEELPDPVKNSDPIHGQSADTSSNKADPK